MLQFDRLANLLIPSEGELLPTVDIERASVKYVQGDERLTVRSFG